ncbi:hypothetical protein TNCV_4649151 [Trichonephila clavipes]|uniref:Uncharacterized protein n=1 Tax=Trichonephila clavipes TaxID=2585209 RepID=A0A8X6T6E6_TRICX|nr:hypothetical protein TNCV_4649151 [Trichonephila clavipes]
MGQYDNDECTLPMWIHHDAAKHGCDPFRCKQNLDSSEKMTSRHSCAQERAMAEIKSHFLTPSLIPSHFRLLFVIFPPSLLIKMGDSRQPFITAIKLNDYAKEGRGEKITFLEKNPSDAVRKGSGETVETTN